MRRNIGRRGPANRWGVPHRRASPRLESPAGPFPVLTRPFLTALLVLACAVAVVAAGCSDEQSRSGRVPGDTLTIFSSLPAPGAARRPGAEHRQRRRSSRCARPAAGSGDFKVNFASADDATAGGDRVGWDPDKTAENARKAVENTRTIAYIGDFDSGATAISLPITNEAGFVQVSPASTAVGPDEVRPRRPRRASRTSSIRPATAPLRAWCRRTTCRRRRPRAGRGGSARAACT